MWGSDPLDNERAVVADADARVRCALPAIAQLCLVFVVFRPRIHFSWHRKPLT